MINQENTTTGDVVVGTATATADTQQQGGVDTIGSRNAKWYYSTFHNVTAIVGAGVLGLPYAFSQLGWVAGVTILSASWLITFYTLWQLVHLHEMVPGKRFDRYPELGEHAFGQKLGYWLVMPQQMLVQVASDIVYLVIGGKSFKKFVELAFPSVLHVKDTYYILGFMVLHLFLSQAPNFNSLKGISLIAALMSFSYCAIAFVASTVKGTQEEYPASYDLRSSTSVGRIFNAFNGLGTIAFAFAGHSVALEIQATIPSEEDKPSKGPMWLGVQVAYFIVIFCYLTVAVSGYWAFGHRVEDDVLISLQRPAWIIAAANLMVFIHVIGSYQVFAMPVFDLIEKYLTQRRKFKGGKMLRLWARTSYVAFTGFVAMCIPFFGGLLGFFGGLVFSSTSYFLPCIIWLTVHRPKPGSFHWFASWICIIFGSTIAVLAPIGGARQIILSAKTYKLFS